jgi:hypothetical protein
MPTNSISPPAPGPLGCTWRRRLPAGRAPAGGTGRGERSPAPSSRTQWRGATNFTSCFASTATQFASNSSGRKVTAVNRVESSKASAPSVSHSNMAASQQRGASIEPLEPQHKVVLCEVCVIARPWHCRALSKIIGAAARRTCLALGGGALMPCRSRERASAVRPNSAAQHTGQTGQPAVPRLPP